MKFKKYFNFFTFFLLTLMTASISAVSQTPNLPAPRDNKLLNGARLLVWNDAKSNKVSVKIRIHSGSAFDPLGKEGVMQLLSDILFPTQVTKEFFTEDLNGSFEIVSNYDYIQINASGDADKFLTILETLAPVITNPTINKETTEKVKAVLLERVKELEKNPTYIADRAAAKQLFGNFPYGRPALGTPESIAKIDFADLLTAEQKFLTADNATIAISGKVDQDFALRAIKRLFGSWLKADKKIPATFAQPDAPATRLVKIEMPNIDKMYVTTAIDTVGRSEKDFWATQALAKLWQKKYCFGSEDSRMGVLNYEPHLLRGVYFIRQHEKPSETPEVNRNPCSFFMLSADGKTVTEIITQIEFETAKQAILADFQRKTASMVDYLDLWLDTDTYKLVSVKDEAQKINAVTLADLQRISDKLLKQPSVTVSLTRATEQKQNN